MNIKTSWVFLLLLIPVAVSAQPDFGSLQEKWIQAFNDETDINGLVFGRGYLFYRDGETFQIDLSFPDSVNFEPDGGLSSYSQLRLFRHDERRMVTAGTLRYRENPHVLLTGWRETPEGWKREIDILLSGRSETDLSTSVTQQLDAEREEWVRLANRHDPAAHIRASYTEGAVYFSNGSRSDGHTGIAERYSYMKNPGYQVDLEAAWQLPVSGNRVLEVGRYFTGDVRRGDGGLYVILWQPQAPEKWKIVLDFNF